MTSKDSFIGSRFVAAMDPAEPPRPSRHTRKRSTPATIGRTMPFVPIAALSLTLLVAGCGVSTTITLAPDGSATVDTRIELGELFVEYLLALGELTGEGPADPDGPLFDLAEIERQLEVRPGVQVRQIEAIERTSLHMEVSVAQVEQAIDTGSGTSRAIRFTSSGDISELSVLLSRDTFDQISALFPLIDNPLFASLGPQGNEGTSEDEYLDMTEFMLGFGASEAILASTIELTVKVRGTVTGQNGGTRVGADTVRFAIPLIDVLLLEEPLEYRVAFRGSGS